MKMHRKHAESLHQTTTSGEQDSRHVKPGGVQRFIDNRTTPGGQQGVFSGPLPFQDGRTTQLRNAIKAGGQHRIRSDHNQPGVPYRTVQRFVDGRFQNLAIAKQLKKENLMSNEHAWISDAKPTPEKRAALQHFDNNSMAGNKLRDAAPIWNGIDVEEFCEEVTERVEDPQVIDQGATQTCGVVSVLYLQAYRNPMDYVNRMVEICFEGEFKGKAIARGETIIDMDNDLDIADRLYIVPFRQSYNRFVYFNGEGGDTWGAWLRAFSTPWGVANWMKEEVGYTEVKIEMFHTRDQVWKGMAALQDQLEEKDVVLFVSTDTKNDIGTKTRYLPNHYVVLDSLTVHENRPNRADTMALRLHSWGGLLNITLTKEQLGKLVWGTISGRIPQPMAGNI